MGLTFKNHGGKRSGSTKKLEDWLAAHGFSACCVERQFRFGKTAFTRDAFEGIADVIAVHRSYLGTLYVSYTIGNNNHNARMKKILELSVKKPHVKKILQSGNTIAVMSFGRETGERWLNPRITTLELCGEAEFMLVERKKIEDAMEVTHWASE